MKIIGGLWCSHTFTTWRPLSSACMHEVMFEHFAKSIGKLKNKTKAKQAKHSFEHCEMGWDRMRWGWAQAKLLLFII